MTKKHPSVLPRFNSELICSTPLELIKYSELERISLKKNRRKLTQLILSVDNSTSAAACEKHEGNGLFLAEIHW